MQTISLHLLGTNSFIKDFSHEMFRFEDDLHSQFPHLEAINGRQFHRPGYIELYELEKMKEDPELASIDSDVSDPTGLISADDKYDLAAVKKGEIWINFLC